MFSKNQLNKRALSLLTKSSWSNQTKPWIVIAKMGASNQSLLCNSKGYVRNFSLTATANPVTGDSSIESVSKIKNLMQLKIELQNYNRHDVNLTELVNSLEDFNNFLATNPKSDICLRSLGGTKAVINIINRLPFWCATNNEELLNVSPTLFPKLTSLLGSIKDDQDFFMGDNSLKGTCPILFISANHFF